MSGSERIRFLVILSAEPGQIPRASEQIARELSRKFGGATVMGGEDSSWLAGYWAEDGHAFKGEYDGDCGYFNTKKRFTLNGDTIDVSGSQEFTPLTR